MLEDDDRRACFSPRGLGAVAIWCVADQSLGREAFILTIEGDAVMLRAGDHRGALYGLLELLEGLTANGEWNVTAQHAAPDFVQRAISFECLLYPDNYNAEYTRYLIRRLAKARINCFHIGFMEELLSFDGVVSPAVTLQRGISAARLQAVNEIIEYAGLFGIDCYAHYRVFTLPEGTLHAFPETAGDGTTFCPSSSKLMEVFRQVMAEVPKRIPGIKGLVLLLSEGNGNFFECGCHACAGRTESDTIAQIWETAQDALGINYEVVVRSYLSGWRNIYERPWFTPFQEKTEMLVMANLMRSDQFITHPRNSLIGLLPNLLIDIDLYGEYWGWGEIPCCAAEYLAENMNALYDSGVEKTCGRIGWVFHSTLFDSHAELNFDLYACLAWNRKQDPRVLVRRFCAEKYGEAGADRLTELYMGTCSVATKIFYCNGMCINSHSRPAESLKRFFYLMRDFSGAFFDDAAERMAETEENFHRWFVEKDEAVQGAKTLLSQAQQLYGYLRAEDARYFENTFGEMLQTAKLWNLLTKAVLTYRLYQLEPSELQKDNIKQSLMRYLQMGESQAWRAKLADPGYAFGVFNDIRERLGEGLDPWAGYVPTGARKQTGSNGLHTFSGVGGYIDV